MSKTQLLYLKVNQLIQDQKLKNYDKEWLTQCLRQMVQNATASSDTELDRQFTKLVENQKLIMHQRNQTLICLSDQV